MENFHHRMRFVTGTLCFDKNKNHVFFLLADYIKAREHERLKMRILIDWKR